MKGIYKQGLFLWSCISMMSTAVAQTKNPALESLKINQIQVLGTHNSYARPVDPRLFQAIKPVLDNMEKTYFAKMPAAQKEKFLEYHPNGMSLIEGLKYDHPPLSEQLDSGLRSLELDVYNDPDGGRFAEPAGYVALRKAGVQNLAYMDKTDLEKPGFKLLHMADLDFRTYHTTLVSALKELKSWSQQNPDHAPIFIMIEAKDNGIPLFPNATQVLPFDQKAFELLDQDILQTMGRDRLILPDDVRGGYKTLRDAVKAGHWPTVAQARGKFVFLLLPSAAGLGEEGGAYVKDAPNLEKKVMFVQSSPESSFGAFLLLDNAKMRQSEIQRYVKEGFLVRTRADIETYEAKVNDYSRAEAAFSSGAQIISTDFFKATNTYGTPYRVQLPKARDMQANPINAH